MRSLITLLLLTALLVCSADAASEARRPDRLVEHQIQRVEAALPTVSKNGRTLELSLQGWMDSLRVPGASVAVIDDYRIVWAKGYGAMAAGANDVPVTIETLFQAGSIGKPITALAVLRHVEQGAFDLDRDINAYLRSWKLPEAGLPDAGRVTLRDLLAHTAGIAPGGFAGYGRDVALPTILQILEGTPPATNRPARASSAPGSAVSYSGLGYTIVQLALTDRLRKPFEDIIKTSVLGPVGMRNTTFQQALPEALEARAARGHLLSGQAIPRGWYVHPELAAAGMWTTASDLALLAIEVAKSKSGSSNRVLSRETTRQMLTQHRDEMGLGFVVRPGDTLGYFAHSGGNEGYRSNVVMFADTGKGMVVLTNSDSGQLLTTLLKRSVAQVYEWPLQEQQPISAALTDAIFAQLDQATSPRRRIEVDGSVLTRYVGRYELAPGLEFEVTQAAGHLDVRLGDQPRFPVYAESESKFFFEVVDAQITFVLNEEGRAVSLVLHQGGRDQEAKRMR